MPKREPIKIIFEVIWTKREDDPARYERFKSWLVKIVERYQASQESAQQDDEKLNSTTNSEVR
jgi:hypothetical protein